MKRVGVILQRSILILLLFCMPCWALLINAHNILLAMKQEDEVARYVHSRIEKGRILVATCTLPLHMCAYLFVRNIDGPFKAKY